MVMRGSCHLGAGQGHRSHHPNRWIEGGHWRIAEAYTPASIVRTLIVHRFRDPTPSLLRPDVSKQFRHAWQLLQTGRPRVYSVCLCLNAPPFASSTAVTTSAKARATIEARHQISYLDHDEASFVGTDLGGEVLDVDEHRLPLTDRVVRGEHAEGPVLERSGVRVVQAERVGWTAGVFLARNGSDHAGEASSGGKYEQAQRHTD